MAFLLLSLSFDIESCWSRDLTLQNGPQAAQLGGPQSWCSEDPWGTLHSPLEGLASVRGLRFMTRGVELFLSRGTAEPSPIPGKDKVPALVGDGCPVGSELV